MLGQVDYSNKDRKHYQIFQVNDYQKMAYASITQLLVYLVLPDILPVGNPADL